MVKQLFFLDAIPTDHLRKSNKNPKCKLNPIQSRSHEIVFTFYMSLVELGDVYGENVHKVSIKCAFKNVKICKFMP